MTDDDPARHIADLRVSYERSALTEADLADTPLAQFRLWFDQAVAAGVPEPNAMALATAGADGFPTLRTVLLKQADERGFVFYTNYTSRKSRDLIENPRASVAFAWIPIYRQVVVRGHVERVDRDEAAEYFAARPRDSQLGAWASRQSSVIDGPDGLRARYTRLAERFPDEVPLPDFWGGWLIRPATVEFWQGRPSRLHDRLRYRRADGGAASSLLDDPGGWLVERLAP